MERGGGGGGGGGVVGFIATAAPEAVPEGCSRPGVGVAVTCRMFERSARRLHVRCHVRTRCRSHGDRTALSTHICESTRAASAITSAASSCTRSRQGSSLRSDPLCRPAGLDDTCAQLEGSTYVMAEELVASFRIDESSRQTYGEDLVGAITHPLRSRIRRGALQPSLSELRCSPFNN
jgi:hypothetical protein